MIMTRSIQQMVGRQSLVSPKVSSPMSDHTLNLNIALLWTKVSCSKWIDVLSFRIYHLPSLYFERIFPVVKWIGVL